MMIPLACSMVAREAIAARSPSISWISSALAAPDRSRLAVP
jgi:hypothetical protein